MGTKSLVAQIMLEHAWAASVETGVSTPPWAWMDANTFAKITIPSLKQTAIVLDTASGQALAFGPAHMHQTPHPGRSGTATIAAHKNTHFAFLKDMQIGDIIEIQMPMGDLLRFKTVKAEIVHKDNSGIPNITPPEALSRLALVTCYPFNAISFGGPMRYVITADLME